MIKKKIYKNVSILLCVLIAAFCLNSFKYSNNIYKVSAAENSYINIDFLGLCNYYYPFPYSLDGWSLQVSGYDGIVNEKQTFSDTDYTLLNYSFDGYYSNITGVESVQLLSGTTLTIEPRAGSNDYYNSTYDGYIIIEFSIYDNTAETTTVVETFLNLKNNNKINFGDFIINGDKLPKNQNSSNFGRYNFGDGGMKVYFIENLENLTALKRIIQPVFYTGNNNHYALFDNVSIVNYESNQYGSWKFDQMSAQVTLFDALNLAEDMCPIQQPAAALSAGVKPYKIEYMPNDDSGEYVTLGLDNSNAYYSNGGNLSFFNMQYATVGTFITNQRKVYDPPSDAVLVFVEPLQPYPQIELITNTATTDGNKAVTEWYPQFYATFFEHAPEPAPAPKVTITVGEWWQALIIALSPTLTTIVTTGYFIISEFIHFQQVGELRNNFVEYIKKIITDVGTFWYSLYQTITNATPMQLTLIIIAFILGLFVTGFLSYQIHKKRE